VYKGPVTTDSTGSLDALLATLRRSHDRLTGIAAPLTADQVTGPSYDDDWSIAQVLSHLGSGAEIFSLLLDAGLHGEPSSGTDRNQEIWDRWNGKNPEEQVRDAIVTDAAFLDRLAALDAAERDRWRMPMFGGEQDLSGLARMRLNEHTLHTWDVAVMLDARDTLPEDAVEQIIDTVPGMAGYVARPAGQDLRVHVATERPARSFRIEAGPDGASLVPADAEPAAGEARLRLPAEALVRLIAGRLDPAHTPAVASEDVDLDALRAVFPGF